MIAPLITKNMDGQTIMFNMDSKVVITQLDNKFDFAGRILNWHPKYGSQGFGINNKIIQFVLGTGSKLLIKHDNNSYWIDSDTIQNFIAKNKSINYHDKIKLRTLPLTLFKSKPVFSGMKLESI